MLLAHDAHGHILETRFKTRNSDLNGISYFYLVGEVDFVGEGVPEGAEAVLDEVLEVAGGELVEVLLQVGPGRLTASADGHGLAGVEVGRGTGLDDGGALLVEAGHEHADAIGPLVVALDAELHLVAKVLGEGAQPEGSVVEVPEIFIFD